jgi:predicted ribosome quality control (RQC) complex YloA/Tae2 family protein
VENFFLNDVIAEIIPSIVNRRVSRISGAGFLIRIDFAAPRDPCLVIRSEQSDPALFLADHSTPGPEGHSNRPHNRLDKQGETPFVAYLRNKLTSALLISLTKPPYDRVVTLSFEATGLDGSPMKYDLVLALTGKSTDALLLKDGTHLEASLRGTSDPGAVLKKPTQIDFIAKARDELSHQLSGEDPSPREIIGRYFGPGSPLGPIFRREFESRAAASVDAGKGDVSGVFLSLVADLFDQPHLALVYSSSELSQAGRRRTIPKDEFQLSCTRLVCAQPRAEHKFGSFSKAASAYYAALDGAKAFNSRYDEAIKRLRVALKKNESLLRSVNSDLARFEDPQRSKRYGDLLLANLATAKITGSVAVVTNLYDESQAEIEIQLEEGESARQAASRYYELYQKSRRALKSLEPRAASIAARVASLKSVLESLEAEPTLAKLSVVENKTAELLGAPKRTQVETAKKARDKGPEPGRRFKSSEGYDIVVGKNDRDNDTITFRVAGSLDVWLHAADYPGSHVIIRNPTRQAVPYKTIVEAAEVAAFYSQAKKEKKAAVHYTQKKFVTKPPKSKPGLVRLSSFKTLMVEPKITAKKVEET